VADATIDRVIKSYGETQRPFLWLISPASTPDDLGTRLVAKGLTGVGKLDVLLLRGLDRAIAVNADVVVRELRWEETFALADRMGEFYGPPAEVVLAFNQAYAGGPEAVRCLPYMAYLGDEPVS
jgi:hypothetical protein